MTLTKLTQGKGRLGAHPLCASAACMTLAGSLPEPKAEQEGRTYPCASLPAHMITTWSLPLGCTGVSATEVIEWKYPN